MTAPLFTVLLPHLRNVSNDAALRIALDTLITHTALNFELMVESVAERRDIYGVLNDMAERANTDWILPTNSDVFYSPGWAEPLWEARAENTIVSPIMVECGKIGVHVLNYERDFGSNPAAYRRQEFEDWVRAGGEWRDGDRAWYFPSLLPRRAFLGMGGFDLSIGGFPAALDIDFWDRWEVSGRKFRRARSWVYHLQQWSFDERQAKEG